MIKNPPANAGDPGDEVPSLVCDDPLEEGTATHSSILAWRIPWTGAWRATVHRLANTIETTLHARTHAFVGSYPGRKLPMPSSGGIYMPVQQRLEVRLVSGDLIRLGECMPHTVLKINKRKQKNRTVCKSMSFRSMLRFLLSLAFFFPHPCLTDIFFPKLIQPLLLWNLTS